MYCNKQIAFERFRPYFAIAAYNSEEFINDVDLNAIYVKNRDPRSYTDKQAIENERLTMLVKKSRTGFVNETDIHPHDLLSASIRSEYKKKILNSGVFIDIERDDQFEILFKYYELLLKFISNLDDMYHRIYSYQGDQSYSE